MFLYDDSRLRHFVSFLTTRGSGFYDNSYLYGSQRKFYSISFISLNTSIFLPSKIPQVINFWYIIKAFQIKTTTSNPSRIYAEDFIEDPECQAQNSNHLAVPLGSCGMIIRKMVHCYFNTNVTNWVMHKFFRFFFSATVFVCKNITEQHLVNKVISIASQHSSPLFGQLPYSIAREGRRLQADEAFNAFPHFPNIFERASAQELFQDRKRW